MSPLKEEGEEEREKAGRFSQRRVLSEGSSLKPGEYRRES